MSEHVPIKVVPTVITERAVLCILVDDPDEPVWIPKSCIYEGDLDYLELNEMCEVNVAEWFAEQEGL